MIRIKGGTISLKKRKYYLKLAKGYVGSNSRLSIFATEQVIQSLNYAYIGRRLKKRNFRRIWITRINAAARIQNINYSFFLGLLRKNNILLNRKILSFFAINNMKLFISLKNYLL
jgi:large subunit ribosomal protein L20